jgi:hypothetical protein
MVAIDKSARCDIVQYSHIQHEDCEGAYFLWQNGGRGARGIIGSYRPSADGKSAHVVRGYGIDSEGCGFVYGAARDLARLAYERIASHVASD